MAGRRMMSFLEAAQFITGRAVNLPEAAAFDGVTTDSRAVVSGELFIALRGDHFDGHEFVLAALQQGAVAAMVESSWLARHAEAAGSLPLLVVADCRRALGDLAAGWRSRFELPLIAITGSNGKTTVKEMCAAILRQQAKNGHRDGAPEAAASVLATVGNLNNDIGMPLMLLRLRDHHRVAVIEMGMNHLGEIQYLANIARPTVAVITNAQRAHLAGLGGLSAVAQAKGEIFAGLVDGGSAVINLDDPHAGLWRELSGRHPLIGFSLEASGQEATASGSAQITGRYLPRAFGGLLQLITPAGTAAVELSVPGRHNAQNALAGGRR